MNTNPFVFLREKMPSDDWPRDSSGFPTPSGRIGDLFGVPVIESTLVPEGTALVAPRYVLDEAHWASAYGWGYDDDPVRGHVQRRANALRAELGLPLVDYALERSQRKLQRWIEWSAERAGMPFRPGDLAVIP